MGLFIKLIKIDGIKSELYPTTFGSVLLYPNGTQRTVKKLTWNGWKVVSQKSLIESDTDGDSYYYFNKWVS